MKNRLGTIAVAILVIFTMLQIAYAAQLIPVAGNVIFTSFTSTDVKKADGNTITDFIQTTNVTRNFTGSEEQFGTAVQHSTAPGDLLWENRGQPEPFGQALAVAVQGNVVVATGGVWTNRTAGNWFVRAHDAKTGVTLWEDRVGAPNAFVRSQEVAVDDGRVFASGWLFTPAHGFDFVIRAYDLNSGALLWEQRVDRGGTFEFAEVVVAHGGRVFAAGRVLGASGSSDFALFAFDAQTGEPLWESVTDPSGLGLVDIAVALRAEGDRVFVAGTIFAVDPDGGDFNLASNSLLVRAYDARTGAILWEDKVPDAMNWYTRTLAAEGHLLFVGGSILNATDNLDFMVRAYDTQTGALVWMDQVDQQVLESATAFVATGDRLFAAGWDCDASGFNCHDIVRAYDAQTGAFLWQDRFNEPGGDVFGGIANPVLEVDGGHVFLGGAVLNTSGRYEWTIRMYDAKTGTLGWEERIDGGGFLNLPNGFAAQGDRLYAAGSIANPTGHLDFTVRAYKTR